MKPCFIRKKNSEIIEKLKTIGFDFVSRCEDNVIVVYKTPIHNEVFCTDWITEAVFEKCIDCGTDEKLFFDLLKYNTKKFKVVTLCGSTKFKEQFLSEQKRLTLEGNIVISVGLFGHSGDYEVWTDNTKEMLDDMHKRKIDLADEIFVINVDGYIGESTRSEINYAISTGKTVEYLVP
jgi:hypothetical protein